MCSNRKDEDVVVECLSIKEDAEPWYNYKDNLHEWFIKYIERSKRDINDFDLHIPDYYGDDFCIIDDINAWRRVGIPRIARYSNKSKIYASLPRLENLDIEFINIVPTNFGRHTVMLRNEILRYMDDHKTANYTIYLTGPFQPHYRFFDILFNQYIGEAYIKSGENIYWISLYKGIITDAKAAPKVPMDGSTMNNLAHLLAHMLMATGYVYILSDYGGVDDIIYLYVQPQSITPEDDKNIKRGDFSSFNLTDPDTINKFEELLTSVFYYPNGDPYIVTRHYEPYRISPQVEGIKMKGHLVTSDKFPMYSIKLHYSSTINRTYRLESPMGGPDLESPPIINPGRVELRGAKVIADRTSRKANPILEIPYVSRDIIVKIDEPNNIILLIENDDYGTVVPYISKS